MWTLYCCVKSKKTPIKITSDGTECWGSSCLFHYCESSLWLKFNLRLLILFCQLTNIIRLSSFVVITHSSNAKTKKTKMAAFFLDTGPWQKKKIRETKKKKWRKKTAFVYISMNKNSDGQTRMFDKLCGH